MLLLAIIFVAGFINGSFTLPVKRMTEWKEESIWLSFSCVGLFILPCATGLGVLPNFQPLLNNLLHSSQIWILFIGGTLFGVGQICFATAFRRIGIGLNFAISISISTVCVALVELFMDYQLIFTWYSFLQIAGVTIFLLAITKGTSARIEKGALIQNRNNNKRVIAGVLLSIAAGIGSACQGISYHLASPKIIEFTRTIEVNELSAMIVIWAIILTFAFLPYFSFFLYRSIKNQSWSELVIMGTRRYWVFALMMGLSYWASLVLLSYSNKVAVGKLHLTIIWPLFMISIVLTSNFWSWMSGEWNNISIKAVKSIKISIGLMLSGLLFFSFNVRPEVEGSSVRLEFVHANNHKVDSQSTDFFKPEFVTEIEKLFFVSLNDAQKIIDDFHIEMKKGLIGTTSSLNMHPSFTGLPQGNEKGEFIALDLGGTNFRVMSVKLDGARNATIISMKSYIIEKALMRGSGEELFDFIAAAIRDFMIANEINFYDAIKLGFTFSFPVKQDNIASGILLKWTKGFSATGVVGRDVVKALNEALTRQSIENIQVSALVLDAVATLATKNYSNPLCSMGVILGTGTDACYPEKIDNIQKVKVESSKNRIMVNLGWGNFDRVPQNMYDAILDSNSIHPGQQKLEKLVSGMYLGEILRLVTIDLIDKGLIFKEIDRRFFSAVGTITTEHMSLMEGDASLNLKEIDNYLRILGVPYSDLHTRKCFQELSRLISIRSARLSATLMVAVIKWMDQQVCERHIVGIDGSLYEKSNNYKNYVITFLSEILNEKISNVTLSPLSDGSGIGAAIIAAITESSVTESAGFLTEKQS